MPPWRTASRYSGLNVGTSDGSLASPVSSMPKLWVTIAPGYWGSTSLITWATSRVSSELATASTMCARGAIAYAHSRSRSVSTCQKYVCPEPCAPGTVVCCA